MWGERAHLLETDGGSLLAEALTTEVKAVLADETSLVGAEAAIHPEQHQHFPSFVTLRWDECTHHWREPFPYLRGRENQTASWVILDGLEERRTAVIHGNVQI